MLKWIGASFTQGCGRIWHVVGECSQRAFTEVHTMGYLWCVSIFMRERCNRDGQTLFHIILLLMAEELSKQTKIAWIFDDSSLIVTYSTTVDVIQINMLLGIRHKTFLCKHLLTTERSSLRYGLNSDWSRYIWILVLGQTEYCSSELQYLWADWWLVHRFLVIYWF